MCGRFAVTLPVDAMSQLFDCAPANNLPTAPRYNVCPTQQVSAVVSRPGGRKLVAMRWGFLPVWYKKPTDRPLLINARSETIASKPAFKSACRERRCLIPANGFFEWTKDPEGNRLPWYIHPSDGETFAFAGIWQNWNREGESLATCAIVTTAANRSLSALHSRMPVVIRRDDAALWLGEKGKGAAALMNAAADDFFEYHRVSTAVNSNRAQGIELTEKLGC
ncbi:MAG: SOS response-associated peptidase [Albidovulum sp.]|nr:SOS response-associated peptidase [Albidovulum sp.]MDE0533615.1 SOS response-associated peptidase [Albidovulum sp.]